MFVGYMCSHSSRTKHGEGRIASETAAWEEAQRIANVQSRIRIGNTKTTLGLISIALDLFKLKHGRYPRRLIDLSEKPDDIESKDWPPDGYFREMPLNGWHHQFVYRYPGTGGRPYDMMSLGMDGREGGEGFDADIPDEKFKILKEKK